MKEYEILSLESSELWSEYLHRLPVEQQDIYFSPEYYRLYQEYGDGKAQCFVFKQKKEIALYPFLLSSINDLGYSLYENYYDIQGAYGYNGIVTTSNDDNFIFSFYSALRKFIISSNIIAEFTRFHPLLNNHTISKNYYEIILDRNTVFIDLKYEYEHIFNKFQTTTKKQIKKNLLKNEISFELLENDISLIDKIYFIYNETMSRVNANNYLYFNIKYFINIIKNTNSILFILKHCNIPIAFIIAFKKCIYLNGHIGGALTQYLSFSPYSLLYAEMIKFGIKNGCKYLHVGGGLTSNSNDPLLKFKLHFSKNTAPFYIGKKIHNLEIYSKVLAQWEEKNPEKIEKYHNHLLKYKY